MLYLAVHPLCSSNPRPAKSHTALQTVRHRFNMYASSSVEHSERFGFSFMQVSWFNFMSFWDFKYIKYISSKRWTERKSTASITFSSVFNKLIQNGDFASICAMGWILTKR